MGAWNERRGKPRKRPTGRLGNTRAISSKILPDSLMTHVLDTILLSISYLCGERLRTLGTFTRVREA